MQSTVYMRLAVTFIMTWNFNLFVWGNIDNFHTGESDKVNLSEAHLPTLKDRPLQQENTQAATHKRSDDSGPLDAVIASQAQEITFLKSQLQGQQAQIEGQHNEFQTAQNRITALENTRGSTFVRWGRSQCPSNSEVVYTGIAGGARFTETGSGSNRLCLTHNPQFDQETSLSGYHAYMHGAEWYIPGHGGPDAPCVVCRTPHPSTIMIPGTKTCPQGWTTQYAGHIVAGDSRHASSSEFLCADGNPEDREGTGTDTGEGAYFMYSVASCGTLPCPPYVNGKVVTCVVCSK